MGRSTSGAAALDSTAASLNDALGLVTTPYVSTPESAPAGAGDGYAATPAANALTLDAIDADLARKYSRWGFEYFEPDQLWMYIPLSTIRAAHEAAGPS